MRTQGSPLAWTAVWLTLCIAVGLALLRTANGGDGPFGSPAGSLAFGGLFAAPAMVGLVGTLRRQPLLHVVAGVGCLALSVLAFSGATLVLLVPAVAFVVAGLRGALAGDDRPADRLRSAGLAVAISMGLLAALLVGGLPAALLLAFVTLLVAALHSRSPDPGRLSMAGAAGGVAVLVLLGASGFALFATTETVCWAERPGPGGAVYERRPPSADFGPVGGSTGFVGAGCDSGVLSVGGSLLSLGLEAGAVVVAVGVGRLPGG